MKEIRKQGAQGDVLFTRIDELPSKVTLVQPKPHHIVAHSGTGHHHIIDNRLGPVEHFAGPDPMTTYLRLQGDSAQVQHLRPTDAHETVLLTGGVGAVYEIRRQREWTPEGWRRVED